MGYKSVNGAAKINTELAEPIKNMIEAEPSFSYRTVLATLGMDKSSAHRIFQVKGRQVSKHPFGERPRIEAKNIARRRAGSVLGRRPAQGRGRQGWLAEPKFIMSGLSQQNGMLE